MNKIAYAGADPKPIAAPKLKAKPRYKGHRQKRDSTGRLRTYRIEDIDRMKDKLKKWQYDTLAVGLRYSYTEAVDVLGVKALGTVKSRLNRARNALDKILVAELDRPLTDAERTTQ